MGIRFRCPQGHKIHVKTFLAGKRGICPTCGARVMIPTESTESKSSTDNDDDAGDDMQTGEPAQAIAVSSLSNESNAEADSSQLDIYSSAHGSAGSGAKPFQMPGLIVEQAPSGAAIAQSAVAGADPIREAPNAQWYVRHSNGQQYGPAPASMFTRWMSEGRVPADALLWREGWPDWLVALDVFPQLGVAGAAAAMSSPVAQSNSANPLDFGANEGTANLIVQSRRKDNSQSIMIISIVMLLLIGVLGAVFAFVMMDQNKANTPPAATKAAKTVE